MNQTNPSASPPNGISKLHPTPACSTLTVRSLPRPAGLGHRSSLRTAARSCARPEKPSPGRRP